VIGLKLDAVEIARPPDLGRDNTIADQVYRLAKLQAVGSGHPVVAVEITRPSATGR
jgi:hypothetical protein